ncbi:MULTISPECIES: hypothetical protein [unclassified Oceanispirochaeta]|uniref:hypothetical protein n=1 Tax=unclassified Oceanispirochaeta TaxID=2635722 RepID=UPI000E08D218|nr:MULTISPECIES: hypothetical protein [unclassified Oceanispirochaeta]MBF9013981.1 hypothetical protein [Oceanispirochaeta sp. M2]NPD70472.1 hypothetical protein [Oceanispirochaeta sp. M1]RDG34242.1 hypothetical protein DV872_00035 [Oceanispirochaeta sp. M1]
MEDPQVLSQAEQIIMEKFAVNIVFESLSFENWDEQVFLSLTSPDVPDMIEWDFRPFKMAVLKNWVNEGLIRPLPDLESYPNLKALSSKMSEYDRIKVDSEYYVWPLYRGDMPGDGKTAPVDFLYRRDWAEELGLYRETYTIEEFFKLAEAFVEYDPGKNGPGKTIGYAEVNWGFGEILRAFNNPPMEFVERDGEYVWTGYDEETLDGIKFMQRMYQEGVYFPEFYLADYSSAVDLFRSGRVGIIFDNLPLDNLDKYIEVFKGMYPQKDPYQSLAYMTIVNSDGEPWAYEEASFWSSFIFPSHLSDSKMDTILRMLDFIAGSKGKDGSNEKNMGSSNYNPNIEIYSRLVENGLDSFYTSPDIPSQTKEMFIRNRTIRMESKSRKVFDLDYQFFNGTAKSEYAFNLSSAHSSNFFEQIKRIIVFSEDVEVDYSHYIATLKPEIDRVLDELNLQF